MNEVDTKIDRLSLTGKRLYDGSDLGLATMVAFLFGMMFGALLVTGILL